MISTTWTTVWIRTLQGRQLIDRLPHLEEFARRVPRLPLSRLPSWLSVLAEGLNHDVYCLEAVEGDQTRGFLPLAFVSSMLFGRYLVSLPYLNTAGVLADDPGVTCRLLDRALSLADQLKVRFLELRNEEPVGHPAFTDRMTTKVHMRLQLPDDIDALWDGLIDVLWDDLPPEEWPAPSAEWIAEAPSQCYSTNRCTQLPLANFGTVRFNLIRINGAVLSKQTPSRIIIVKGSPKSGSRPTFSRSSLMRTVRRRMTNHMP